MDEKKADELAKTEGDLEKVREKTRECERSRASQTKEIKDVEKQLSEHKVSLNGQ